VSLATNQLLERRFSRPLPLTAILHGDSRKSHFARTVHLFPPAPMTSPSLLASTPEPPYYAVIFTSKRTAGDLGYGAMANLMVDLASTMPGYLGAESVRDASGLGITVSYWKDEASIRHWKQNHEHLQAQEKGRSSWYEKFSVRVAKVERAYTM